MPGWVERAVDRTLEHKKDETSELNDTVASLKAEVAALNKQRTNLQGELRLSAQVETLLLDKAKLEADIVKINAKHEVERAKLTEQAERNQRELEHKTGLLLTQTAQEQANAVREAQLDARESKLAADLDRVTSEMSFQRDQMKGEVERAAGLLSTIVERLPDVNVMLTNKSGKAKAKDEPAEASS